MRLANAGDILSSTNNLAECTLLDAKFSRHYGFTHEDVDYLVDQMKLSTNREHIKNWYNGYRYGQERMYNPWSIVQFLHHNGVFDNYWLDSGSVDLMNK
eukprot:gene47314-63411_t